MNRASKPTRAEEPLIGALLRSGWESVRARIQVDLAKGGFADIGAAHLAVLQYPSPRGLRINELASRAQMSRQAINYLIRELEERGYVQRLPDPRDKRARAVHLTERGESAVRVIRASVRRLEREWRDRLGGDRFSVLRSALVDLAASPLDRPTGG